MKLNPNDISALMDHYRMTKDSRLSIFSTDPKNTEKLYKAGLVVEYAHGELNRPLTSKGLALAQLILDYANEVQ